MNETGILNRNLSAILAEQGHGDKLMVVDAGFAIPDGVKTLDLSLKENLPTVYDVLMELKQHFSVEQLIVSEETQKVNPTFFKSITKVFQSKRPVELVGHADLREMAKTAKAIIRTGDFTAYGNVMLISGVRNRWYFEIDPE